MRRFLPLLAGALMIVLGLACASGGRLPRGYWPESRVKAILDKTKQIDVSCDLSGLLEPERAALARLLRAGPIFQDLYERQMHADALSARQQLIELDHSLGSPRRTRDLLTLEKLFQGPIATTLDNRREAFLPVQPERPGKNVYPEGADSTALAAFVARHPEALGPRTLIRSTSKAQIEADLATLAENPPVAAAHPGLEERLTALEIDSPDPFYVVPYALAYASELVRARSALQEAADLVEPADTAFASYLRLRADDLIGDTYRQSDSAWVSGRFRRLNAQIGSYETYDDALYGAKTFFAMSLLVRDYPASEALAAATGDLQKIEDDLPYTPHERVRSDIPVGVYDVYADFGQARGANTATILPNDPELARTFGRTILIRENILKNPVLFADAQHRLQSVLDTTQADDLDAEGIFHRTVWHEIGHYLGPTHTRNGRAVQDALGDVADLLEEMKADLIALHAVPELRRAGYYADDAAARSVYASGVLRTLLKVRPRRDQPYGTMELMQFNDFLQDGLLRYDAETGRLHIDYERFPDVVDRLLGQVLALQQGGDRGAAERFVQRLTEWNPGVHGALGARMRAVEGFRYRLVHYSALDK